MIGGGKGHELLWSKKDDQLEYEYCKNLYLGDIILADENTPLDESVDHANANSNANSNASDDDNANSNASDDDNSNSDINVVQEDTIMLVKSIFAKFKSYNKEPAKPIIKTTSSAKQQAKAENLTNDIKNQFKYKGKLIEYVSFTESNESNESNEIKKDENVKKMDYASFKKQFILNNDNNNNTSSL